MPVRLQRSILIALAVVTVAWCAGLLAAPLLRHAGVGLSDHLYAFYARVCHQLDGRSWHLDSEPLAACIRCSSIYFSSLVSLIVLLAFPSRWSRLPSMVPLAAGLALMAADAFLNVIGAAVSTEFRRIVTGSVVGALLPWYLVPLLLEAVAGFRRLPRPTVAQGESVHVRETE